MTDTPPAEGFCEPAYGARSLGDVVPAAARALGTPVGVTPTDLELPDAPSYVVFLIDGLGHIPGAETQPAARRNAPGAASAPPPV